MAVQPRDVGLLSNPRFRRLLEARVLGQTAYNALLYALLILVVEDTDSSLKSTFLIVALTLPSIILGVPAGAVADVLPKRFTLTVGYLLRAAIAAALVYYKDDLFYIYVLAMASSAVVQFVGPAESATLPAVVRPEQLAAANSLMMLAVMLGQIAGMVALAPLLIKLTSSEAVFVVSAGLFLGATYVVGWMASGFTHEEDVRRPALGVIAATREGFRILRTNRHALLAIIYLTTAMALTKVLVVLLPKYTREVLGIAPEDAVFVAAPAAIGAALGLALVPPLVRFASAWRVAAFGFALFLAGLMGLGLVVYVRDFIQAHLDLGISFVEKEVGVSSVITVTMLLAIPLGFAFSLVSVATRVVMNEQAPAEAQGRVFAVQGALGDFLSLPPLLAVGAAADLAGVRATLLVSAVLAAAIATYLTFWRRRGPGLEAAPVAEAS
jgi:MFS family permease